MRGWASWEREPLVKSILPENCILGIKEVQGMAIRILIK